MTISQSDRLRPRDVAPSPSPPPVSAVAPAGAAEPSSPELGESEHPTLDQPIFRFDAPTPAPNAADFESIPETEAQVQKKRRRRGFAAMGATLVLLAAGWIWRPKEANTAPPATDATHSAPGDAPAEVTARGAASSAPAPAVARPAVPIETAAAAQHETAAASRSRTIAIAIESAPGAPSARENPTGAPHARPASPHGPAVQLTHSVPAF